MARSAAPADLIFEDLGSSGHPARYRGEFELHAAAFRRLVDLLNDPDNERRLQDESRAGRPALAGVVEVIEADPAIRAVLSTGPQAQRFRQAVGVVIMLKMARLGWSTTGRKGTLARSRFFTRAECYQPPDDADGAYRTRARAGLAAIAAMGDEDEQAETVTGLIASLEAARAAEGRAF